MRPLPFLGWALFSGLLWGVVYPGIGYLGGTSWAMARGLSGGAGVLISLGAALVAFFVWRRRYLARPKGPR
jgi:undecaprenyl-diphosphatase